MVQLSKRLLTIANEIPQNSRVADIGTDHALLPVFLAENGRILHAVAGDVNPGPVKSARAQVKGANLEHKVDVRQGDGLDVISPHEVDTIVIAGMGGALICDILNSGRDKLQGIRRLILQPNVGEDRVRRWLYENEWLLWNEQILEEDGKIYEILTAVPVNSAIRKEKAASLYRPKVLKNGAVLDADWLFTLGPYLIQNPPEPFFRKWERQMEKWTRILRELKQSKTDSGQSRQKELKDKITRLKEVLSCLQKDKP